MTRPHLEALLVGLIALKAKRPATADAAQHWLDSLRADQPRRRRSGRDTTVAQRTRILERDDFRCRRCGAGPRDERLVVDHVVPVALGGSSDDDNLQTLCEPCNQGKGALPPHAHDLRRCAE